MDTDIKLSSKVAISAKDALFFISVDNEVLGYVKNKEDAKEFLDDLVPQLEKEIIQEKGNVKVFRETYETKVLLSYQLQGKIYNGPIIPIQTIEYSRVPQFVYFKE